MSSTKFILISACAHAVLVAALMMSLKTKTAERRPIEVEVLLLAKKQGQSRQGKETHPQKTTQTSPSASATRKASDLKSFKPKYFDPKLYSQGEETATSSSGSGTVVDDSASAQWGSGSAEFSRIEDYGLMDGVYRNVDSLLFYPGVLAVNKIEGTVNARLVLNSSGRCDWDQTEISANDSHLRIYILDVLKRSCRQDFARYVRGRKRTNIDLSFQFAITEHNDREIIESKKKVIGNVLLFYRNSQKSVAEWSLGPFKGMFPIPAVSLDFAWLQKNWDEYMHGPQDELRDFRERGT